MANNVERLSRLGQSIWLDYIERRMLTSGELDTRIGEGLLGMTSNPTIFEKAIGGSDDYDAALRRVARSGASAERIGRRYLATLAQDIDSARLLTMSPVLARALQTARHDPGTAARELRQAVDVDFHRADTVVVDGWILAATEARLCAVIALA
jgi:transaldolase